MVPCAFLDLVITFHGRLFMTGAVDWSLSGFMSMYRFRGRRSTLDMVVVFGVL